ncbi:unnamed protein product [Schistosoma curassoni]|uniref:Uncharacterized protein n=1 Tax=Schistosoma curassoni TaxID=6186 RepID=A0A183JNG6_9TREM|nr:unnamed protein product [Schistosoma curassoni]
METLLAQQAVAGSMVTGIPPHIFSLQPSTTTQIIHGNANHPCKQMSKKGFLHDIDQYKSINNDSNLCKISTGSVFTSKVTTTTTGTTTTTTTTKPSILPIPTISNILNSSIQYTSKSINSHYTNQGTQFITTINGEQDYKNQSFQSILDTSKPTILSSSSPSLSQSNDNQLIDSNKLSLLWNQKFIENTFIAYFNQILYESNMNQLDHQNIEYFKPSISSSSSSLSSFNVLNTLNQIWKSQWNTMKLDESNLNENNPINKEDLNESIKHNHNHDCTTYNDTMDTTDYQQISILENFKKFKFMNSNHWMNKDHSPRNNHLCNSNETEEIIKPLTDSITSIT